jgi:hypothetical protein
MQADTIVLAIGQSMRAREFDICTKDASTIDQLSGIFWFHSENEIKDSGTNTPANVGTNSRRTAAESSYQHHPTIQIIIAIFRL